MDKTFMECHGYTFKSSLGEGAFGKVVAAHSTHLRRLVAIKVINTNKLSFTFREKFLTHEKKLILSLKHPNIVKTHEIFESRLAVVYVVMELCGRGSLSDLIAAGGALPEEESCRLFQQLCEAIRYLHDRDVAHRDLKCENLLLDLSSNLKLCDFDLSKTLTYRDGQVMLSQTYCGTAAYAAPEVLRQSPYNPKMSDVWSMGVVLYNMLYACAPFTCTTVTKDGP